MLYEQAIIKELEGEVCRPLLELVSTCRYAPKDDGKKLIYFSNSI